MAIKIDLLPDYVPLRRTLKWTISGCVVVLGLAAGTLFVIYENEQLRYETAQSNLTNITKVADQARTAKNDTDAALADAAPKKNVVDFVYDASRTGPQRTELMHLVRRYIDKDAYVGEIDMSDGQSVVISASVQNNAEYAKFLDDLRSGSDTRGNILYAGKPGQNGLLPYPDGNKMFIPPPEGSVPVQYTYPITIKAKGMLLNPQTMPADPVSGAPAAGAGAPGAPGTPPAG